MNIKRLFERLFDAEDEEVGRVGILLIMSFFLGAFLASFAVASQSLFLLNFDEIKDLPLALVVSGAIGIAATYLYNLLQGRVSFQTLGMLSLLTITAITALIQYGENNFADKNLVYFLSFTALAPFTFITLLIFWGSFNRMFNVRQAKRLLGSVDVGYLVASLIAFFSIPVLLNLGLGTEGLFIISLASIIVLTVLFFILSRWHLVKYWTFKTEQESNQKVPLKNFFGNKYIVYLSLFIVISTAAMVFIDYSFLSVAPQQFDQNSLPKFLSYFEATVVIFSFLFQTFIAEKIISDYGLKVSILVNPLAIGLFTVAAMLIGLLFGYTPDNGSFIIFFIMIAMSKLIVTSMRDSLDEPVFKLYLLPVDASQKIDVQTKIEGTIAAFASIIAGGLIMIINRVEAFGLIYVTVFALPIIVFWYVVGVRMYGSYRHTLQGALVKNKEKQVKDQDDEQDKEYTVDKVLEKEVNGTVEDKIIYGLRLMERLEPAMFEGTVIRLSESEFPKVKAFARNKVQQLGLEEDQTNRQIKELAKDAAGLAEDSDLISVSPEKLMRLSKSPKPNDRILAVKLLRKLISPQTIFILLELMRDMDPRVRIEAIQTARKVKRQETWSILIEMLSSPTYGQYAAAALVEAGEAVLFTLETAFHKSAQSDQVMMRIIQLMGRIGSDAALDLLWKKIDYPDKRIVKQILYSLRYIHFQADGRKVQDIMELLDMEMGKTMWNLAAYDELPDEKDFKLLREALREEIRDNYDQMTMLLSLVFDPQSIQLVKENLESGNPDNIQYALELLDLFVTPELKVKLFPLLDDSSIEKKLEELQTYFPRESYTPIQVINYILNRDFNVNNRWSKVCAVYTTAFMKDFRVSRGLIAQMFNQDKMLQETAAWVIYNKDRAMYEQISERLPDKDKNFLESAIRNNQLLDGLDDGFFLNIEEAMFMKDLPIFRNVPGVRVADLADKIVPLDMKDGESVKFNPDSDDQPIFIVAHGSAELLLDGEVRIRMKRGDTWGEILDAAGSFKKCNEFRVTERSVIFRINTIDLYFILANHHELVDGLIRNVASKGSREKVRG